MRLISTEMHFMRRTTGYTLSDHKRNKIMKELHTPQITEFIKNTKETEKSM
jgi:hypothetical protein